MQRVQPSFMTDGIRNFMAQQKQRKQLILIDSKIFFLSFPTNTTLTTQFYDWQQKKFHKYQV